MVNLKKTKTKLTANKNKSKGPKLFINKMKGVLNFNLNEVVDQIKQKDDMKINNEAMVNNKENNDKSIDQARESKSVKTTIKSKPIISQHRLDKNNKPQVEENTSHISPPQQNITSAPKVESQQSLESIGQMLQFRKAPAIASAVSPSKSPHLESIAIEEVRDIKAKLQVGVDTTSSFPQPQQLKTTFPTMKPQQARKAPAIASAVTPSKPPQPRSIEEDRDIKAKRQMGVDAFISYSPQPQQAQRVSPKDSKEFDKLDDMLNNFSKGEGEFKLENKVNKKPQPNTHITEVKKLIASLEQEAKASKPKLYDQKFYESMYESLPSADRAQTTKSLFLLKARNHEIDKIVRSMQGGNIKDGDSIRPDNSPKTNLTTTNKKEDKGFAK